MNWAERINSVIESGRLIGAIENIQGVISAVNDEFTRLIERFREMQTTAYNFNLPFDKAKNFAMQIRLAGGELEDIGGYLRGITDALVKGEVDDPEFIALSKYGAEIFDATGRLKDYASIWEEVQQAYEKAKAAGEEIEFLQLTGGESGVTDAIQALERWNEAKEDAAKVFKSGIDPNELHQAERAFNLLTVQAEEFHDALSDLITPAMIKITENLFEVFRYGTKFVRENKDEIRELGATLNKISEYISPIALPLKSLKKIFDSDAESAQDLSAEIEKLEDKGTDRNPLSQYGVTRAGQFRDELEDLRLELDFVDDYKRSLAELDLWRNRELDNKTYVSDDERAAIEELYSAKLEKIRRDRAEKIQQIEEESAERTKQLLQETADIQFNSANNDYQQEIRNIWNWAHESISALDEFKNAVRDKNVLIEEAVAITTNALAKEAEAFEKEMDRIKGKNQSLAEKIFEQEHSRRDVDIMRAQKERSELYNEGVYSAKQIEHWFKNRLGEISQNVRDSGASYIKKPQLPSIGNLPTTDFYGNIQRQVDAAMSRADHPAYQLQQQHQQLQQGLTAPVNQFAQSVQQFATLPDRIHSSLVETTEQTRQQPQITNNISPNINIDLGGAYVFDDSMKQQLTDDITEEVANAVKSAVQSATSQANYGYGN